MGDMNDALRNAARAVIKKNLAGKATPKVVKPEVVVGSVEYHDLAPVTCSKCNGSGIYRGKLYARTCNHCTKGKIDAAAHARNVAWENSRDEDNKVVWKKHQAAGGNTCWDYRQPSVPRSNDQNEFARKLAILDQDDFL